MVPEVTTIEIIEMNAMVGGSPKTWRSIWERWLPLNRVKSGMFSESVAQNAIIPIRDGANTVQNSGPQPSFDGSEKIGPKPPTWITTQIINPRKATVTSGAAQFSKRRSA